MYSFDLKNIFPSGGLICLFAKATINESNLWHRRLGHINFKTMNKLVRGNLVRGLPLKLFENDQTCVACQKGKQHKASWNQTKKNGVLDPAKEGDKSGQGKATNTSSTNKLNIVSSSIDTVSFSFTTMDPGRERAQRNEFESVFGQDKDVNGNSIYRMFTLYDIFGRNGHFDDAYDDREVGAEADRNNLELLTVVSLIPTTRVHRDHPKDQIIGDLNLATQTRRMINFSKEHGMNLKKVIQALTDPSWIETMQEELLQFKLQKVWTLVDLPKVKRAIGTKLVYRNKKDERGIVVRNKEILVAHGYTQEEGIDYDKVFAPVARIEAIRLFLAFTSFMGFIVYQMDVKSAFLYGTIEEEVQQKEDGIFISQDKYVADILNFFDFVTVKTTSTPIETNKALIKGEKAEDVDVHLYRSTIRSLMYLTASRPDIMFVVCDCTRFQVTPKTSHLHAVKRIFRYIKGQPNWDFGILEIHHLISDSDYVGASLDMKSTIGGQPKLGLWYPRDSPFDLEAFLDSDYAGASLDRKSTTRDCYCQNIDNGEQEITATVDGKEFTITEASVRKHLQLANVEAKEGKGLGHPSEPQPPPSNAQPTYEEPIPNVESSSPQNTQILKQALQEDTQLPQTSVPIPNVADKAVFKEWDNKVELVSVGQSTRYPRSTWRGFQCLRLGLRGYLHRPMIPLLRVNTLGSDEGSMTLLELTVLCTTLSKKVERLEADLKQTKKVYGAAYNQSYKKGIRMIEEIDQDARITLVTPTKDTKKMLTLILEEEGQLVLAVEKLVLLVDFEDEHTKRTKLPQEQDRLGHEATVRLQEELDEEERQRMTRVHCFPIRPRDEDKNSRAKMIGLAGDIVIDLSHKVEGLESDLKKTKKLYATAFKKLINRVKSLEDELKFQKSKSKRRRLTLVTSEDEEDLVAEDPSKQGRSLIEEMDLDAGISLVPPHVEVQGRYGQNLETQEGFGDGQEVSTAAQVSTAGPEVTTADAELNTASTFVSTASPQRHADTTADDLTLAETLMEIRKSAAKDKGKAKMDETESPRKMKQRERVQISRDEEVAQKLQEEFDAAERQRMAQVHQAAQGFTDAEWDDVLARVAADEDFVQQLQAGEKCSEEDLPMKLVELVNQRKKFFAQQRAEAKRNKPMTPAQQKDYMSNYIKNQEGGYSIKQLKSLSFEQVKEILETTMRRVQSFVPIGSELEVQRLKRAGQEVLEEPVKRQKIGEALGSGEEQSAEKKKELSEEELQKLLVIVPVEEVFVEALHVKYPIIEWEIYSEDTRRTIHAAAQSFTEEEWENIRARVEADEELTQRLQAEERNKYSEVDQA
ncbi:putative ribonuclease H-like domain-containing protein [Tanacetum coccineum]